MDKLKEGRAFLADLYPLKLRVETLENIFSLLFLTNENIREDMVAGLSDSGEEGAVPESRNGSRLGSRDNLSTLESTLEKSYTPSPNPESRQDEFTFTDQPRPKPQSQEPAVELGTTPVKVEVEKGKISDEDEGEVEMKETLLGTFSITKTELKDTSSDYPKKNSGNWSTNSAGSTGSVYKIGFTANPYIVRDMLATLKDCLSDLSSAKFRLTSTQQLSKDPATKYRPTTPQQDPTNSPTDYQQLQAKEEALNLHVMSSVDSGQLQQRTSRLSQSVSEASWRFQLVVPGHLPSEVGRIQTEKAPSDGESHDEEESGMEQISSLFLRMSEINLYSTFSTFSLCLGTYVMHLISLHFAWITYINMHFFVHVYLDSIF